jgi:hypothetical protein
LCFIHRTLKTVRIDYKMDLNGPNLPEGCRDLTPEEQRQENIILLTMLLAFVIVFAIAIILSSK